MVQSGWGKRKRESRKHFQDLGIINNKTLSGTNWGLLRFKARERRDWIYHLVKGRPLASVFWHWKLAEFIKVSGQQAIITRWQEVIANPWCFSVPCSVLVTTKQPRAFFLLFMCTCICAKYIIVLVKKAKKQVQND